MQDKVRLCFCASIVLALLWLVAFGELKGKDDLTSQALHKLLKLQRTLRQEKYFLASPPLVLLCHAQVPTVRATKMTAKHHKVTKSKNNMSPEGCNPLALPPWILKLETSG